MTNEVFIYVLVAYDDEKDKIGEIIVVDNLNEAQKLYSKLKEIYKAHNVTMASRMINHIPFNLLLKDK